VLNNLKRYAFVYTMAFESAPERIAFIKNGTIIENNTSISSNLKINLKSHQMNMVNAMMNLENNRKIECDELHLDTNIGICSDTVGTGKSLCMLALITANKIMKKRKWYEKTNVLYNTIDNSKTSYDINLIVVPHSITKQWIHYIETQTHLNFYSVFRNTHILPIDEIRQIVEDVKIILISSTMYKAFIQMNRYECYQRAIFDEADTISIPSCTHVNSNFTWFITSSVENILFPGGYYYTPPTLNGYIHNRHSVHGVRRNGYIRDIARIISDADNNVLKKIILINDPKSIKRSLNMIEPLKLYIQCKAPIYMRILNNALETNVLEMLNAGDISSALDALGCKCESQQSIVYAVTTDINQNIEDINLRIDYYTNMHLISNEDRQVKLDQLKDKRVRLEIRLASIQQELNNYKDSTCPICWDTFKNPVTTLTCCNKMFCTECVIQCQGTCPMCRQEITHDTMVVINDNYIQKNDTRKSKIDNLLQIIKENTKGKFLIFSAYDTTFKHVTDALTSHEISTSKLSGNASVITKTIQSFNTGDVQTLLLNPNHYGCGLNIEQTTDIIFLHRFTVEMERQIIGRAQRYGRNTQLIIHYLYFENELKIKI